MQRKTEKSFQALQALKEALNTPKEALDAPHEEEWTTYYCTLVTPMYGGGVNAGEVDKDMPIRASSIRGQLRFWWRIACSSFDSAKDMFEKETAIWGGIGTDGAKASQVDIKVSSPVIRDSQLISSDKISTDKKNKWGINYVLGAGETVKCLGSGYQFLISIRYQIRSKSKESISLEELKNNVQQALRWWACFGGIGARTRRGFGAVSVDGIESISCSEFSDEKKNKDCKLIIDESFFPHNAQEAWEIATLRLQQFRQGKNVGRNPGHDNRPGRSRWPEPDQLRRLTQKWKSEHKPEHPAGNVFPRASFGMPILFDFNDRTKTEPSTMSLQPKGSERMASPLILRPYLDENKKWRAAALLLPQWKDALVEELELNPSPGHSEPKSWPSADNQELRNQLTQEIRPMQGLSNDPLSAFLDYFKGGN